jgi:endonuclease/exonuclease/phosphatase family metal-dependent hydrolase
MRRIIASLAKKMPRIRSLRLPVVRIPRDRLGQVLVGAALSYFGIVLGTWVLLWVFGDRWWPGTLVLFGPRWVFLLPALALVPLVAWKQRMLLVPTLLATLVVVGPIMGYRTGFGAGAEDEPYDLRVMTYNIASGRTLTRAMWEIVAVTEVDVAAFQECSREVFRRLLEVEEWHHDFSGSACLSSRFPIESIDMMERDTFAAAGGSGMVVRYTLATPKGRIGLVTVHLDTPREGLEPIRSGELASGLPKLREKTMVRNVESRQAREWARAGVHPFVVTGDFNMPVESNIYERYWSDLNNAFDRAGRGFGATRYNGWIRARIDHVLYSDGLSAVRSYVGPDFGSDHRPMIADLRWR